LDLPVSGPVPLRTGDLQHLLLHKFHVSHGAYGTALLNALIMSKIILVGEYFQLGRKQEGKPLILTAEQVKPSNSPIVRSPENIPLLIINGETFMAIG
jgi:hypothetical protein